MSEQIYCPNCEEANSLTAVYCTACGANLRATANDVDSTLLVHSSSEGAPHIPANRRAHFKHKSALHLIVGDNEGEVVADFSRNLLTVGRHVKDSPTKHLDLSEYGAAPKGVSRKHLMLTRMNATVILQDVGSSNGTTINGERVIPGKAFILCDGDEIRMGKMKLTVAFKDKS